MIIEKNQQSQNDYCELFEPVQAMDVNGNMVEILQSIGLYSKKQLEDQKQNYLEAIEKIDEKIAAIDTIINPST